MPSSVRANAASRTKPKLATGRRGPGAGPGPDDASGSINAYLRHSRSLSLSLFYMMPLVALYELGLHLTRASWRNAADVMVKRVFEVLGPNGLPVFNVTCLAACALAMVMILRRRVRVATYFVPLLVESAIYGVTLGPLVNLMRSGVMPKLSLAPQQDLVTDLLLSVGAGVYEEVFFRLLLMSVSYVVLVRWLGVPRLSALAGALAISAIAFSAFHYLGPYGDPFELTSFVFRALAGAVLGMLFATRGLAVAVYAHAFYDVLFFLTHR